MVPCLCFFPLLFCATVCFFYGSSLQTIFSVYFLSARASGGKVCFCGVYVVFVEALQRTKTKEGKKSASGVTSTHKSCYSIMFTI